MNFDGKVVLITGAGQGIGREYAHAFAKNGAFVVITDLFEENAESVLKEVKEKGGNGIAAKVDVSDEISAKAIVAKVAKEKGRLDVLINNASIFSTIKMKPFYKISVDEWDKLMSVNCRGVWIMCKEVLEVMKKQNKGKIVNISSSSMFMGRAGYLHYVSSKSSIIGMTRSLAQELGEWNITVNTVLPGATITEIERETVSPEQAQSMRNARCIKRDQTPADLVGAVLFFSSDLSDFISGQSLCVDGGLNFQ